MAEATSPSSIQIFYQKANLYRVIHADGALGGITPTRNIFVSIYNQRAPLPTMIEQRFSPDGTLGDVVRREGKTGLFREMEIGIVLTPAVAREIAKFLNEQAKLLEESTPSETVDTPAGKLK